MALNGVKKTDVELEGNLQLLNKLNQWLDSPDRFTMEDTYDKIGKLERAIKLLQKDMRKAENAAIDEIDKPRSNEAKKIRNKIVDPFLDQIADIEAELCILNAERRKLEYRRDMYKQAGWHYKQTMEL